MKNIKIILLSFSLATNLVVTSYAMSQNKNETTVVPKYNLKNKAKNVQHNINDLEKIKPKTSENEIYTSSKNQNSKVELYEINKLLNNKNIDEVITYFTNLWNLPTEIEERNHIENSLNNFKTICSIYKYKNNNIPKDILTSNLNFNLLQSILLDYYDFSVSFNTKYAFFIGLIEKNKNNNKNINSEKYNKFYSEYSDFVKKITTPIIIINHFCEHTLFNDAFNKQIRDNYAKNLDAETKNLDAETFKENEDLIQKTSKRLSALKPNLQKVFKNTKTDMNSPLWATTFEQGQRESNSFIDENSSIEKLEVMPKNYSDCSIYLNSINNVMPCHRISLHVLATVLKMELLKSTSHMKSLNANPQDIAQSNDEYNIFKSYDKLKTYANDIFKLFNSLRCFIVFYNNINSMKFGSQKYHEYKDSNYYWTFFNIFPKTLYEFNDNIKYYMKYKSRFNNIINYSFGEEIFNRSNKQRRFPHKRSAYKKNLTIDKCIHQIYYKNRHNVASILQFFDHMFDNRPSYHNLANISNLKDADEFFSTIDEKYQNYDNTNIEPIEPIEPIDQNEPMVVEKTNKNKTNELNIDDIENPSEKSTSYADLSTYIENIKGNSQHISISNILALTRGLLKYYNNIWNLPNEKTQRKNIKEDLKKLDEIYNKFSSYENINNNISLSNQDFNLLQSILLNYYDFLLSFSKYNTFINLITVKIYYSKIFDEIKKLEEYKIFMNNYTKFTNTIKNSVQNMKKIITILLTNNFTGPMYNDNETFKNNLNMFYQIKGKISELAPNFQKIFEIMEIDMNSKLWKYTSDKFLDAQTPLENIDIIPKTYPKNQDFFRLNLYSINEAPPHYRVNLDILATILKMEILKFLPYFKKMQNNTDLNNKNDFIYNKQLMCNYINMLFQFYNSLKCCMVWSMNLSLFSKFSSHYYRDLNMRYTPKPIDIQDIFYEKESDFIQKIKEYITDYKQFYTTLYLPENVDPNTRKNKISTTLFKLYYDLRQWYVKLRNKITIPLAVKHIDQYKDTYKYLIDNKNPDISNMQLLDQFFFNLDSDFFSKFYFKVVNANNNNFPINDNNIMLQENENNNQNQNDPINYGDVLFNNSGNVQENNSSFLEENEHNDSTILQNNKFQNHHNPIYDTTTKVKTSNVGVQNNSSNILNLNDQNTLKRDYMQKETKMQLDEDQNNDNNFFVEESDKDKKNDLTLLKENYETQNNNNIIAKAKSSNGDVNNPYNDVHKNYSFIYDMLSDYSEENSRNESENISESIFPHNDWLLNHKTKRNKK